MRIAAAGAPLVQQDIPEASPVPGEIVLRVQACGVCGTGLHAGEGAAMLLP